MRQTFILSGLAMALVICSSAAAHAGKSSEVAAVHAADAAWGKAYNAGQLEDVVALYDENAVVYPPGVAPLHGIAAIRDYFAKDVPEFPKSGLVMELSSTPDGGVSGDMGWSSGAWSLRDKAGQIVDSGWYFSVSKKVKGKWLYVRDAWDSSKAPAASSPAEK